MDHSDSVLVVGSGSIDHLCNNSPVLNNRKAHETPTWPVTTQMPVLRGIKQPWAHLSWEHGTQPEKVLPIG